MVYRVKDAGESECQAIIAWIGATKKKYFLAGDTLSERMQTSSRSKREKGYLEISINHCMTRVHQGITCQTGNERLDDNGAIDLIRSIRRRNSSMND